MRFKNTIDNSPLWSSINFYHGWWWILDGAWWMDEFSSTFICYKACIVIYIDISVGI